MQKNHHLSSVFAIPLGCFHAHIGAGVTRVAELLMDPSHEVLNAFHNEVGFKLLKHDINRAGLIVGFPTCGQIFLSLCVTILHSFKCRFTPHD
jgi:hypothetical protein